MLQWIRSVIYTVLLFLVTGFFGVIVLLSALLPLSIEQRYVIPRGLGPVPDVAGQSRLRPGVRHRRAGEPAVAPVHLAVEAFLGVGNAGADVRRAAGFLVPQA